MIAGDKIRPALVGLGVAGGATLVVSLVAAVGFPSAAGARVALVAAAWAALASLVAFTFLPGFDLPWRLVRRTRDGEVALTFDDGPHPETTPALLEALRRAGVRATFFLVGQHVEAWPELARAIAAEGHVVGNHTQRHRLLVVRTTGQLVDEVASCQRALAGLGLATSLFRPPHGFKPVGLHGILRRHGLRLVSWVGSIRDTDAPGVDVIASRALRLVRSGRILLLHDNPSTRGQTALAIDKIVDGIRARGLRVGTLD